MEETGTCKCGCTEWAIYNDRVECVKCEFEYKFPKVIWLASNINERTLATSPEK
jgi:hypothetical protein